MSARSSLSLTRARRAAVFAPVLFATLSLGSLAHAQGPAASPATDSATPQPNSQPLPAAAPVEPAPPMTSQAPAVPEATPVPAPVPVPAPAPAPAPAAVDITSDRHSLRLPRVHQGLYLRFTTGPSFVTLRGYGPSGASASITDSGASGSIAIGGALVPGLVLAGTLQGTAFNAEFEGGPLANATVSVDGKRRAASNKATGGHGMIGMLVDWYPKPTGNWHAGFATGIGAIVLTNSADDSDLGGLNFSGSVFGGYDWSLGRNWALGLQLVASGGTKTQMREEVDSHDTRDTGYRLTPFSVGVQASVLYF